MSVSECLRDEWPVFSPPATPERNLDVVENRVRLRSTPYHRREVARCQEKDRSQQGNRIANPIKNAEKREVIPAGFASLRRNADPGRWLLAQEIHTEVQPLEKRICSLEYVLPAGMIPLANPEEADDKERESQKRFASGIHFGEYKLISRLRIFATCFRIRIDLFRPCYCRSYHQRNGRPSESQYFHHLLLLTDQAMYLFSSNQV